MNLKETVKQLWIKKIESEYNRQLAGKKISYHDWVGGQEQPGKEKSGRKDYVLFCQKEGHLAKEACGWLDTFFEQHPRAQIVYGDEDFLTEDGIREMPWYKPCWSPDTYLSQFYFGSVVAIRRELYEFVRERLKSEGTEFLSNLQSLEEKEEETEKFIFGNPGEIRPLITACIRHVGGFQKACVSIENCPRILFHVTEKEVWERYLTSSEDFAEEETSVWGQRKELSQENGENREKYDFRDVSVIIPSKDNPQVLAKCLQSLKEVVDIPTGAEVIIVDNGSREENRMWIEKLTEGMKYLYRPMEFNFSRMCNAGVEAATGKYLLFLNDDIEVCGREWLAAMKEKAALPYVGAVGLKLYYPDSKRMQHAGITNLPVGPVHKMQFTEDKGRIYFDRNRSDMNCLAVTGACLLIDREKYQEAGGLKESLQVAYNDVELGFALYEAGYHNVNINRYYGYHHESLSRGSDETREKQFRLQKERERLYEMHPMLKGRDPYYPDRLYLDGPDVRIVPGFINALNTVQEARMEFLPFEEGQMRLDPCVMAGVEVAGAGMIKGYGVVLGDNNACYDRYVILKQVGEEGTKDTSYKEAASKKIGSQIWMIKTQPQYRQDLEENIPDQKNVALCGYHVALSQDQEEKLEAGAAYQVGVLAVHKITKGKLANWSSRCYTPGASGIN